MNGTDIFAITGTTGVVVAVMSVTFWLCAIIAFFSIAINASRIRKDVEAMRDIAEVEFTLRADAAKAKVAGNASEPQRQQPAPRNS
ncbi:hypothetical protein [Demequina mangrovi]|uniref:Uncharacterized protein n=1 Tax=Demequina mangrovi TaxID=1043493 RepID=A0A1H6ZPV6_9MICO|nr:hypothetical protein [Demequina mangrovi]SEJ51722.1 hypothetical protein SAMN05421637_2106 [Demequina mangrovi]